MLGRKSKTEDDDGKQKDEITRIKSRLDEGETIQMHARQSRYLPGGASLITPKSIYLTEKRIIIRVPTRFGYGENIEEYYYEQLTNVRLERGLLSASLIFYIRGMTELSKSDRQSSFYGRNDNGAVDALEKDVAEKLYDYVRKMMRDTGAVDSGKKKSNSGGDENDENSSGSSSSEKNNNDDNDPLIILKRRLALGEITMAEYDDLKKRVVK